MHFADEPRIAVIGLGYVGLPLAVALARHFETIGFDIDSGRVAELARGHDRTREVEPAELAASAPRRSPTSASGARGADVYIVTAPTPVDQANRPDLAPLLRGDRIGRRPDRPAPGRRSSSTRAPSIRASPRTFAGR